MVNMNNTRHTEIILNLNSIKSNIVLVGRKIWNNRNWAVVIFVKIHDLLQILLKISDVTIIRVSKEFFRTLLYTQIKILVTSQFKYFLDIYHSVSPASPKFVWVMLIS